MMVNELYCQFLKLSGDVITKEQFTKLCNLFYHNTPSKQTKSDLNLLCRDHLHIKKTTVSIRAAVVIAQILIITDRRPQAPVLPSFQHIQDTYYLSSDLFDARKNLSLVEENKKFRLFVYYMLIALELVNPASQMDFTCTVVSRLSGETLKFATGGGTERISTAIRYRVFEIETRQFRPKTLSGKKSRVRKADLLLPIPPNILAESKIKELNVRITSPHSSKLQYSNSASSSIITDQDHDSSSSVSMDMSMDMSIDTESRGYDSESSDFLLESLDSFEFDLATFDKEE